MERIRTLLREVSQLYQGITIVSTLTALSMRILTIVFTFKGVFGGGGGPAASGSSSTKDEKP